MREKKGSAGIVILVVLIVIVAAMGYLYNSVMFERNAPKINIANKIDWNLKKPLNLNIKDDSGIKFVRIRLSDGKNSILLSKQLYQNPQKNLDLEIKFPRTGFVSTKKRFKLSIEAVDTSKWNFLSGNSAVKEVIIKIDRKKPELYIVNNSYKIIKGGVATVVFKAKDTNLKELYIETNYGKKFYPTPFYKDDYYISLVAWPSSEKRFKATIIAKDSAGNISKSKIRLYLKNKKYKLSKITLKDNFLDGKISDLVEEFKPEFINSSKIEKFKIVNETMRKENENLIEKITSKTDTHIIRDFRITPFYPLKNAAAVASFGDHRYYYYKGNLISESYHLGLDLASTAGAKIKTQNRGKVVFADLNGIYGNNLIIYHGLGVYSLYGHCSSFLTATGEIVKPNQVIAKTGTTGLALGDHLHFGILLQGVEVRPEEWMDKKWMKESIFDIIKSAKKIIDRK